ncbi:heavy metal translocating P-type ATPase [Mucispirillum schaedleri]|jgi:Cu+-exporting ATPase|uniref:P-type Cu(+) transporter n=1 Tax=Mucispirillum schaedleri ASF457 TaxID=1379858 RepID=V2RIQ4_9BACT|nr:heavy metal translocating P-type ATPase [Mucispirillum schaedleri]USF23270.1 putative copper-importing P-type ATPase A [Mucispirillum schaedleri ASF457]SIW05054.1 putative copper-importing P-type ATPase A [Mucispirillum schaedleri ASF457]
MKEKYNITGMTCSACSAHVTKAVAKVNGVKNVNVNLLSNSMVVEYDDAVSSSDIISAVTEAGYGAEIENNKVTSKQTQKLPYDTELENMRKRLVISFIFFIPVMYLSMGSMAGLPQFSFFKHYEGSFNYAFTLFLLTIPVLIVNRKYFINGFKALFNKAPNMDSLVALGSSAAVIYGIFAIYKIVHGYTYQETSIVMKYSHDLYFESAVTILTLITLGKYLETKSKRRTRDAVEKLISLTPKTAIVEKDGKEVTVAYDDIQAGNIIVVKPGGIIACDGIIISGAASIDESAITGESIPVEKKQGDKVISATINKTGHIRFKALKVGKDTTLSQIISLVEDAANSKAPISKLADKISGIFVPIVIVIALISGIFWLYMGESYEFALSIAISVLVISCPCALGLATPVAIMVGTGKGAEHGILIKSAESLEMAHNIKAVALDKTGTITEGKMKVVNIQSFKYSQNDLLQLAYSMEVKSEHPVSKAIVEKAEELQCKLLNVENFTSYSGLGISCTINNITYYAGNRKFILDNNIDITKISNMLLPDKAVAPVYIADNNEVIGIIYVADTIKESSIEAVKGFREQGIDVYMLTGDNKETAEHIANQAGINNVYAELLPQDKENIIKEIQKKGIKTAMVGDGINDAPALMRSDLGIAIGAGTDVALESADIILIKNNLLDALTAVKLSHATIKNIKTNLFWAFFYNIIGIPVAAGIFYKSFCITLNPMIAAAAMSFSSIFVVTNALRLKFFKAEEYSKGDKIMKVIVNVNGMNCNHCKMAVEKALNTVDGVVSAEVNLEAKNASVTLSKEVADSDLMNVVNEAGFEAVSVEKV